MSTLLVSSYRVGIFLVLRGLMFCVLRSGYLPYYRLRRIIIIVHSVQIKSAFAC